MGSIDKLNFIVPVPGPPKSGTGQIIKLVSILLLKL